MGSFVWAAIVLTHIGGLPTILITTHEPPSRAWGVGLGAEGLKFRVQGLGEPPKNSSLRPSYQNPSSDLYEFGV